MSSNQQLLRDYEEFGFAVLKGAFSEEQRAKLLEAGKTLPTYQDQSYLPVMQPHRLNPVFFEAMKNPAIIEVLEQTLHGEVSGLQTQYFFGCPGARGVKLHQDNFYAQSEQNAYGSAWLALEDIGPENGGLIVLPGSHKEPLLEMNDIEYDDNFGQDRGSVSREVEIPEGYEHVDIRVEAGDVVFIHGHVIHGSHDNSSKDRFRQVLLMTFVRKGEQFRAGSSAKREEMNVYS